MGKTYECMVTLLSEFNFPFAGGKQNQRTNKLHVLKQQICASIFLEEFQPKKGQFDWVNFMPSENTAEQRIGLQKCLFVPVSNGADMLRAQSTACKLVKLQVHDETAPCRLCHPTQALS